MASLPGSSSRSFLLDILKIDTEGAPASWRHGQQCTRVHGICSAEEVHPAHEQLSDSRCGCVTVLLHADVAGFDPAVLQGARKLLAARKAGILYFEYKCVLFFESCSDSSPVLRVQVCPVLQVKVCPVLRAHSVWNLWATTELKDVIAQLETLDYNCYFEGSLLCRRPVQSSEDSPACQFCYPNGAVRDLPGKQPGTLTGTMVRSLRSDAESNCLICR